VERKRLFAAQTTGTVQPVGGGIYNADAGIATYARLHQLAAMALQAGYPVVIDATYLQLTQRKAARQLAEDNAAAFLILDCHAPETVISAWLARRQQEGRDPSDATLAVIQAQQASREPLDSEELAYRLAVETHDSASLESLLQRFQAVLAAH
jgi:predicted kinase